MRVNPVHFSGKFNIKTYSNRWANGEAALSSDALLILATQVANRFQKDGVQVTLTTPNSEKFEIDPNDTPANQRGKSVVSDAELLIEGPKAGVRQADFALMEELTIPSRIKASRGPVDFTYQSGSSFSKEA